MKTTAQKCLDTIKHIIFFVLVLVTGNTYHLAKQRPSKKLVIFIHGTLMPALAVLNPFKAYAQGITQADWYYRCLAEVRKNPIVYEDTIMLEEGLQKIDATILDNYVARTLNPALCKRGAYQAIGAYHCINQSLCLETSQRTDYYTWGFSGILSDAHRKQEADRLYHDLIALRDAHMARGLNVQFTLCSYSHGGNVTLYLADAEKEHKQQLSVDTVVLYATPLYKETAQRAYSPLFSTIINCYSRSDTIQVADSVSTPERLAYRSFGSVCDLLKAPSAGPQVIDVEITVDDDPIFDHFSFWCFRPSSSSLFRSQRPATTSVLNALQPLPLAVLTPWLIRLLANPELVPSLYEQIQLSLTATESDFLLEATNPKTQVTIQSHNILPLLQGCQRFALQTWQPHAHTSDAGKYALGFLTALKTILS